MSDQNIVHIAASAVRDRETGHVFCAAILSWPAGQNERVFIRNILPGKEDGSDYVNASAGLAFIIAEAMERLTRRCMIRVLTDTAPAEFQRFLELADNSRKPTAHEAKLMQDMHKTRALFARLAASIEARTPRYGVRFSFSKELNDDAVCEVRSYASAYRDGWPNRNVVRPQAGLFLSPAP